MQANPPAPTDQRRLRRVRTVSVALLVFFGVPAALAVLRALVG